MGRASRRRRERRGTGRQIRRIDRPDGSRELQVTDPALAAELGAGFEAQAVRFREKFGRDPGPQDPLFFDPDADEPRPIPVVKIEAEAVAAMERAGLPPELIYAYQQTGLIVTADNQHLLDEADLDEWNDAIDRYRRLHAAVDADPDTLEPTLRPLRTQARELLIDGIAQTMTGDAHPAYALAQRLACSPEGELLPTAIYSTLMRWLVEAGGRLDDQRPLDVVGEGVELAGEVFDEVTQRVAGDAAGLLGAANSLTVEELMDRNPGEELLFALWSLVCGLVRTVGDGDAEYLRTLGALE